MERFIIAPDSFKGTLSAPDFCDVVEQAIRAHLPSASIAKLPLADGGEGMVQSYMAICGGETRTATVTGPRFQRVEAQYGLLPDGSAVVEMASCAGLHLAGEPKNPLEATTYGVGELLLHAAQAGNGHVLLGIGGSATNDGGIGMAAALGYRFLDAQGGELSPVGGSLSKIERIQPPAALPELVVKTACDVDNPLYGPQGATYVFGPQKGADEAMLKELDAGMKNLARVMLRDLGKDVAALPGAGAAGGLGGGIAAFIGGELLPGIQLLLDAAGFDALLEDADVVFTGEGRIDFQSAHGKVPVGVAERCKRAGVPCIALCGSVGQGVEEVYAKGITAAFSSVRAFTDFEGVKETGREDLRLLADAVVRLLLLRGE